MKRKVEIKEQYGIVNKKVINNKNLSTNAKGLYVYLCARSGNKRECNPKVTTICNDLGVTEATFHKAKNELVANRIIYIKKAGEGLKKRNKYVFTERQENGTYGIVYLKVLTNNKLSLKAKAIYGLLSCLAGARFVAYPLAKAVYLTLGICRNTYFSCMKQLKEYDCLMTKQLHINGRYTYCNFYINGKKPNKPQERYIFKGRKTQRNKGILASILHKEMAKKQTEIQEVPTPEYKNYQEIVSSNIEYEALKGLYGGNEKAIYLLENAFSVIVSNIYSKKIKDIEYKGYMFYSGTVKSIFSKLNYDNVKYAIDCVLKVNTKIKNIRSYLRVALFGSYYETEEKQYLKMR